MIYAVQLGNGPIKFGRAINVKKRLSHLQIGNPKPLRLLASQETEDDKHAEGAIHESCRADLIRGEWFKSSRRTRLFVKRIRPQQWHRAWARAILDDYRSDIRKIALFRFLRMLQSYHAKSVH